MASRDSVGTTIARSASGTVEGAPPLTWAIRLDKCLAICEAIETPCVAVMDAPGTSEIASADSAVLQHTDRINSLRGSHCMLVLAGDPNATYPVIDGTAVCYSREPWAKLCTHAQWGMTVELNARASDLSRMLDSITLLLGSCVPDAGPLVSTALYTLGRRHPSKVFCYATFSDNVIPGSPRVSETRGISVHTSDGKPWSARLILQEEEFRADEDSLMRHVRVMLDGGHASSIGSAYFHLAELLTDTTPSFVRRAMADVHRKLVSPPVPSAPSLCRAASMNPGHSTW